MARLYGAIAVLATYIIVRRIVTRVAMEYRPEMMATRTAGQRGSEEATAYSQLRLGFECGCSPGSASRCPSARAAPAFRQTSLTIYNDGRVLVRRTVSGPTYPRGIIHSAGCPRRAGSRGRSSRSTRRSRWTACAYDGAVDEASVLRAVGRASGWSSASPTRTTR